MRTFDELRDNLIVTTRATANDADLMGAFVNLTLQEIGQYAPWTWLRRKTTFDSVASQESYNLDEEVDRITLLRQRNTPLKLLYVPDEHFFRAIPNPEDLSTGVSRFYRLWEETGFLTQNTVAERVNIVSTSTADGSSFKVIIRGRESARNLIVTEELTLNGTTTVTGTTTYAIGGLFQVSKSASTTGTITVAGNTSGTTLSYLAPNDRAPRYKRLSLYPIPTSAVTFYLEYLERLQPLVNDADVPQFDHKWLWVLREGSLAKAWEYKQSEQLSAQHLQLYFKGLEQMKRQDMVNLDHIPVMQGVVRSSIVKHYNDSVSNAFPIYGVGV